MKQIITPLSGTIKIISAIILCLFFSLNTYAQRNKSVPSWIDYSKRKSSYPENIFVTGFASEDNVRDEDEVDITDRLKNYARTQLIESIQVSIKSIITSNTVVMNVETEEYFRQTSVSLSKVKISGLIVETYYDEKEKIGYAFTYAKRADISKLYRNMITTNKEKIERNITNAKSYSSSNDNQNALKSYYESIPLFRDIEEAHALIITFEKGIGNGLFIDEVNKLKLQVDNGIKTVQKSENLTIDDVAFFMAKGLKMQTEKLEKDIRLVNFTYQDSKMASSFSKRFNSVFEKELTAQGMNVSDDSNIQDNNQAKINTCVLTGTYWEEGNYIKLIAIVRDLETGKAIASTEALQPLKWLNERNIKIKPDNFDKIVDDLNAFNTNEISNGDLAIKLTTNKGDENLIFTNGEKLILFVRANKECYLRFIYHLADGTRVLLLDNYHIDNTLVNKLYPIPDKFVCCEPFGVETLQLNAQSTVFQSLNTKKQDGYNIIQDQLKDVLAKTRGFKKVTDEDTIAEKIIVITTLEQ